MFYIDIKSGKLKIDNTDSNNILHRTIKNVTKNLDALKYNVAISNLMVYINNIYKKGVVSKVDLEKFLIMLHPFAPHLASEILNEYFSVKIEDLKWPKFDANLSNFENICITSSNTREASWQVNNSSKS